MSPGGSRRSSSVERAKLHRLGGEGGQDGGGADGQVRGRGGEERQRLVAGSTKIQSPKVQFKLNKNNTFVRGEIEKCEKVTSHGRTDVCTDKAVTTRFTTEKAKGSRKNVTNAIYQTDESTEIDGGGDYDARMTS